MSYQPIDFPVPVILEGGVRRLQVQVGTVIQERTCIVSASGAVYELGRMLKEAIYGQVHSGCTLEQVDESTYRRTTRLVAVKIISRAKLAQLMGTTQEDPIKEIAALQYVGNDHPNVMGQIECISDVNHFYSVMNFSNGGELYDLVDANGKLTEVQARHYFAQMLDGLEYLQNIGVCHRDMSLENMLVTRDGNCKIIDLGMSLRCPVAADGSFLPISPQGACGKRNYISPESLANVAPFIGPFVDIWALGVILFILLTGVPPVETSSQLDPRFRLITSGGLRQMLIQWNIHISEEAMDLLQRILQGTPSVRLTIAEIKAHPWMNP
jgi:serine/threonine protein kinase